jgi:biotin-(acetyl-CoA carboxylase) ligase
LKDSLVFKEGLVVTANFQSGGNGQRGKAWESNANENLLLSVVIEPKLKLDEQSLISKIACNSILRIISCHFSRIIKCSRNGSRNFNFNTCHCLSPTHCTCTTFF